jgi:ribosomal protein S18 acetylase RimI-like enzyme
MTTVNTPMDIEFQGALESDASVLADLRVAAMRESLERVGRFDPVRARERLLSSFDATATRHVLADGSRVGFVVVRTSAKEMLLDHLYIDPRHQGRGVGAAVLAKVFSEADRHDLDVRVGALKESASNRFYMRHGFEPVAQDEWDIYYVRKASAAASRQGSNAT